MTVGICCKGLRPVVAIVLLLFPADAPAQPHNSSSPQQTIVIEVASEEIRLYPALATAAGQAVNRAADRGLDRMFGEPTGTTKKAVAKRFARLYFANLPIAALSHFAAHEFGHVARLHELDATVSVFRVIRWPWPVPFMEGAVGTSTFPQGTVYLDLSVITGGSDAAVVQEHILTEQIYSKNETDYFDWVLLLYAKLDMPLYTWATKFAAPRRRGDPRQYAELFGTLRTEARFFRSEASRSAAGPESIVLDARQDVAAVTRTIERKMWLNIADYALVSGFIRSIGYIRTGERNTMNPALRVGRVSFVPAARFSITPVGLETAFNVRFPGKQRLLGFEARATETATGERLWGAGFEMRSRHSEKWAPLIRTDLFQRRGDPISLWRGPRSTGVRLEVGASGPLRIGGNPFDVSARVGYKTPGYLFDAPERRTILGGVSIGLRF